jgi:N-acetylglucosaminyldiphosphoundecaprenol N-acetyl-beta-D-mannosaminyltransferase
MAFPDHSTVRVRGLDYLDADLSHLTSLLRERLNTPSPTVIFTPNAKIAGDALRDASLHALLEKADLLLPDGAGILLTSRRHADRPLAHRLPGIEAGEIALQLAAKGQHPVYFLGGKPGVAERAAKAWQERLPPLPIAGTNHGYFDTQGPENESILQKIRESGAQILFVCLGFPAQERWIVKNKSALPAVRLFMGLGGSFDVWSGNVRRAPALFRAIHAEWLWRMLAEPRRFVQFPALIGYVFGR